MTIIYAESLPSRTHNTRMYMFMYIHSYLHVCVYCLHSLYTLHRKFICSNSHSRATALSALIMLLCCSLASATFSSKNLSSLSVDRLNSKRYTIFRASLIATPSGGLPQKRFTKKDPGSRLYRASWLFLTGIFTSISCACSASALHLAQCRHAELRWICQPQDPSSYGQAVYT